MGFIRENGIIITIVLTLAVLGYVWHLRGSLDSAKTVAETEKTVEPIQQKEIAIGNHPLTGLQLLGSLQHHKY